LWFNWCNTETDAVYAALLNRFVYMSLKKCCHLLFCDNDLFDKQQFIFYRNNYWVDVSPVKWQAVEASLFKYFWVCTLINIRPFWDIATTCRNDANRKRIKTIWRTSVSSCCLCLLNSLLNASIYAMHEYGYLLSDIEVVLHEAVHMYPVSLSALLKL